MIFRKTGFRFSGSCFLVEHDVSENRLPLFRIMLWGDIYSRGGRGPQKEKAAAVASFRARAAARAAAARLRRPCGWACIARQDRHIGAGRRR